MKRLKAYLFVIGCILSLYSHVWAADLPFGQTQTGTISSAAQSNIYVFSANANDIFDFTLVATSGSLVPKMQLYSSAGKLISSNYSGSPFGCSGSALEMNTIQLPATDAYTVDITDCSSTNIGEYALYAQRTNNPTGAANLPFGQAGSGAIGSTAQSSAYTFSANANDVVDFTLVATSSSLVPKIRLYNPNGTQLSSNYSGSPFGCSGSTLELNTVQLPASGNYTALIGDCADTNTGNYEIYTQRTDSPTAPVGLLFGQVQTGSIGSLTQSKTYTFSANSDDVVDFTLVTTSGNLVPKIRLYNPNGAQLSSNYSGSPFGCSGSTLEMNTVQLPASGTYTVLIGDCADTNTGNYAIYSQRTNNPTGAASLPFGQTQTGLLGSVAGSNTYTFSANANDVVDFTLVTTNGSLVPKARLYNPSGTQLSSNYSGSPFGCSDSTLELNTVQLPASGTYTVLIGDCSDTNTGNYAIYSQRTNNPDGPVSLLWGQVQTGMIGSAAQSASYTFPGSASNVVDLTLVTTGGNLVPKIRVYNPDGTLLGSNYSGSPFGCSGSTVQMNSVTLAQSGTYTVLLGDCSDTNTGNYNLSAQCFGTCPLSAPGSASQTISFGALSNQVLGAATFTISATASSGLPVSFASTTSTICTISGATVTSVAVGTCSITANQAGNANYAAATSVTQSFTVGLGPGGPPPAGEAPLLSSPAVAPSTFPYGGGTASLSVVIQDAGTGGVQKATAAVQLPDGTTTPVALSLAAGSVTNGTWRGQYTIPTNFGSASQLYNVSFSALDSTNNMGQTPPLPFAVAAAGSSDPSIQLTSVPPFGSFSSLSGQVTNVSPQSYQVAVLIFIEGLGWYSKPYCPSGSFTDYTPINADGTWSANITSGLTDTTATQIVAYLVPSGAPSYPCVVSGDGLPANLENAAVAKVLTTRTDPNLSVIQFAGQSWWVKSNTVPLGPGPTNFSSSINNPFVDGSGRLHLKLIQSGGMWYGAEVVSDAVMGNGTYSFSLDSDETGLDPNVVVGFFTWSDNPALAKSTMPALTNREIDVEFGQLGANDSNSAQFVVQPYQAPGDLVRFAVPRGTVPSSYEFQWYPSAVNFEAAQGLSANPANTLLVIKQSTNSQTVPQPGNTNFRMNVWLYNPNGPANGQPVEVIVNNFQFTPLTVTANSVSPSGGSGTTQTFTLQYSDSAGASDLNGAQLWFTPSSSSLGQTAKFCLVFYSPVGSQLYLENDAGTGWLGPVPIGSSAPLSNSQCSVNAQSSSVVPTSTQLTLSLPVTFAPRFAGQENVYGYASGATVASGWQALGTWTVAIQAPSAQTITFAAPSNQVLGTAPFTLNATASSGLAVTFASNTPSVCTISGIIVTLVNIGTCLITASQAGNTNYAAAAPVNQSFIITNSSSSPGVSITSVGNSASFTQSFAPGMLMSVFGTGLSTGSPQTVTTAPLPLTSVSGTTATINGISAPLLYVSATQINLQIPYEVPVGSVVLTVNADGRSSSISFTIQPAAPGIFTDPKNGLIVPSESATAGSTIVLFLTGAGQVTPAEATGNVPAAGSTPVPNLPVTMTVGSVPVVPVYIAIPDWSVGELQINFTVPSALAEGTYPVVVIIGGVPSPAVLLNIMNGSTTNLSVTPAALQFQIQQGAPAQSESFQIGGTAGTAWQAAVETSSGGAWLSVSPGAGQIPASLTALVNSGSLTAGTYQGNITVNAPAATPSLSTISVALTVTAVQLAQTITFGAQSNQVLGTAPFALSATASSGLAVSFASSTTAVCSVSGITVTLIAVGTCSITATQSGNPNYAPATPVTQSFTVT